MDYYDRVRKEPSVHQKLVVCASIGNKLETMQSQIVTLKDEVALMKNELKDQAADLKDEVTAAREEATTARKEATAARKEATAARKEATAARKEATAVRKEATAVREEVEALKARLDVYDQERLYSYSANLLTHMLKNCKNPTRGMLTRAITIRNIPLRDMRTSSPKWTARSSRRRRICLVLVSTCSRNIR